MVGGTGAAPRPANRQSRLVPRGEQLPLPALPGKGRGGAGLAAPPGDTTTPLVCAFCRGRSWGDGAPSQRREAAGSGGGKGVYWGRGDRGRCSSVPAEGSSERCEGLWSAGEPVAGGCGSGHQGRRGAAGGGSG